jgi:hypothetical protein
VTCHDSTFGPPIRQLPASIFSSAADGYKVSKSALRKLTIFGLPYRTAAGCGTQMLGSWLALVLKVRMETVG